MADDYTLTHKHNGKKPNGNGSKMYGQPSFSRSDGGVTVPGSNKTQSGTSGDQKLEPENSVSTCAYCKKPGHLISECRKLERKHQHDQSKFSPNALVSVLSSNSDDSTLNQIPDVLFGSKLSVVAKDFQPFISKGFVSVGGENAQTYPVSILRDTGASQSLMLEGVLPLSDKTFTGTSALIQGVELGSVKVPLHKIHLASNLITESVVVGIRPKLPFEGISFVMGNDLARGLVLPFPQVTSEPVLSVKMKALDKIFPGILSSCAVTGAVSQKLSEKENSEEVFTSNDSSLRLADKLMSDINQMCDDHISAVDPESVSKSKFSQLHASRKQLIEDYKQDPEIALIFDRVVEHEEVDQKSLISIRSVCEEVVDTYLGMEVEKVSADTERCLAGLSQLNIVEDALPSGNNDACRKTISHPDPDLPSNAVLDPCVEISNLVQHNIVERFSGHLVANKVQLCEKHSFYPYDKNSGYRGVKIYHSVSASHCSTTKGDLVFTFVFSGFCFVSLRKNI